MSSAAQPRHVGDGVEPILEPIERVASATRNSTIAPARCALRLARSIAAAELSMPVVGFPFDAKWIT
jgi:hypothetical protein